MFTDLTIVKLIIFRLWSSWCYKCFKAFFLNSIIFVYIKYVCIIVEHPNLSLSLSRSTIYVCACMHPSSLIMLHVHIHIYIYRRMIKRKSERFECLESRHSKFKSSVSGRAARRRIVDMFAFFDYSKAAEALSVHAHVALHM